VFSLLWVFTGVIGEVSTHDPALSVTLMVNLDVLAGGSRFEAAAG
jgi:hypothetical protein